MNSPRKEHEKKLFDKVPLETLQAGGCWIDDCEDYALMILIVELARCPECLPQYLYSHERPAVASAWCLPAPQASQPFQRLRARLCRSFMLQFDSVRSQDRLAIRAKGPFHISLG